MVNYYQQITPMVGSVVNRTSYQQPTYYNPPSNHSYYRPSPQIYPSYTYVPYYQQPSYQQPSAPSVPTQPRQSTPTVTTQKAGTPVIQGKNVSYQKVSDLGAIGDTKTVQMPDGSYRNYTRTGTNTYQYTEVRAADKATVMAKSDANGAVQVTKVTPSASAPPSSSVSTVPLVLYEIPNNQHITTSDIPTVGSSRQVNKPDGGFIVYKRVSSTQIQYQEYSKGGQITTPWTSIYDEPPTVAPAAKLTPAATSPPVTPKASEFIAAPLIGTKTRIASSSKSDKPDFSVLRIKSSNGTLPGGAPAGEGEGKEGPGEESAEESEEEKQAEKDEGWVPDWIEKPVTDAFGRAKDPFERLYNYITEPEVEIPPSESGVVGGGVENPVSPTTEIPSPSVPTPKEEEKPKEEKKPEEEKSEPEEEKPEPEEEDDDIDCSDSSGGGGGGSDGIPRTDEEKQEAVKDWLNKEKDYYQLNDNEVDNLSKYFSPMLPAMTQNKVDLKTVASNAQLYEDLFNGKAEAFEQFDYALLNILDTSGDFRGFESLPQNDQLFVLQKWNEKMIDDGIPAIVQASFNAGIYTKMTQNAKTEDAAELMRKGEVLTAIKNDTLWQGSQSAESFLKSKDGMAAIGLTFQSLAGIGAFMVGGPLAAVAVAGTTPFSATELWQTWGDNPFTNKANLQLDAKYAFDYAAQHDDIFRAASKNVDAIGFNANSNNPAANLQLLSNGRDALGRVRQSLKDNYIMLQAAGMWEGEVSKYQSLKDQYCSGKGKFTPEGNFDQKQYMPSNADLRNIPVGYHVEWNGQQRASGDHKIGGERGTTEGVVIAIRDSDGVRIPLGSVKVQPFGVDTVYDVGSAIEKALSYKSGGSANIVTGKTTVYLPPGVSFTYEGKKYTGGDGGTTFDIKRQSGAPLRLEFTAPGKKPLTEYIGFPESGWNSYAAPANLKGDLAEPENYEGFTVHLLDGQKIYINGLESNKYISGGEYIAVPYGAGKYDVRIVNADGSTAYHNPDEYVSDGKMTALPTTAGEDPKQPYQKQSYGGGGGGGGGYSGGGGGGGYQQQPKPEEETLIIYGPTCKDAELWQDEVQVYPEIDEPYSISPGYHSIKAVREGFKPWLKTVYCASGDSITVSPAFEPVEGPGEPTEPVDSTFPKRVFINSDPSGGLVLVNGSSSGEWTPCYLDLPEGYYTFTIKKSGYDPYDIVCYVGEVIAWNNQAIELATSRGWI